MNTRLSICLKNLFAWFAIFFLANALWADNRLKTIFEEEIAIPTDSFNGYVLKLQLKKGDILLLEAIDPSIDDEDDMDDEDIGVNDVDEDEDVDEDYIDEDAEEITETSTPTPIVVIFKHNNSFRNKYAQEQPLAVIPSQLNDGEFKYVVPFAMRIRFSLPKELLTSKRHIRKFRLTIQRKTFSHILSADMLFTHKQENWSEIANQKFVVSGMVSTVYTPKNGKVKIAMFGNRIYGIFSTGDTLTSSLVTLHKLWKKRKENKVTHFFDFRLKIQISGIISQGVKPRSTEIVNPTLHYYALIGAEAFRFRYVHTLYQPNGKRMRSRFTSDKSIRFQILEQDGTLISPDEPPVLENMTSISGKLVKSSKWTQDIARVKLLDNRQIVIGDDPFSFYQEAHFIDTCAHKKRFGHNLNLIMQAIPSSELRGLGKSYKNGVILNWESTSLNISVYPTSVYKFNH